MKLSERHTFEKPAGSQEDQVVNVDGKGRQACLEVPGIVLEATLPGPIKWNYVASQRMCVVKITMASTGPRSSDSPGPASGRSRADVSAQPKQCGHRGHGGSPQGRRPKGWGSEASADYRIPAGTLAPKPWGAVAPGRGEVCAPWASSEWLAPQRRPLPGRDPLGPFLLSSLWTTHS